MTHTDAPKRRWPNPFRGLPNPREVWAWGMYDLANQSFTLLIITLLFALYLKQTVVMAPRIEQGLRDAGLPAAIAPLDPEDADRALAAPAVAGQLAESPGLAAYAALSDDDRAAFADIHRAAEARGDSVWSWMHGGSLLVVVLLSPILGAYADAHAKRKQFLVATGFVCAAVTVGLAFAGPGALLLAVPLYVVGNVCYQLGENFLASFLPSISTRKTIGRISALGWSMGYVGALLLLVITLAAVDRFGLDRTSEWRPLFVMAGVWFAVFMLPVVVFLRDDTVPDPTSSKNVLVCAATRLARTVAEASKFRQLALFLLAFAVYGFGIQVIVAFASIIAEGFGIRGPFLVVFVLQITITAGAAAYATSRFQDRLGTKNTLLLYLAVWILGALALLAIDIAPDPAQWTFWATGNLIGFGLGGAGTASRAMVGQFTPRKRSAEFFGLWGLTYKCAGAVGVLSFGWIKANLGDTASLVALTSFFVVGSIITLFVNERAGILAAHREQRADPK